MTDIRTTQIGVEQWAQGAPRVQATQVLVEQWATVRTITPLSSTVAARSSGRSNASVIFAGVILHATATARSYTRADRLSQHISIAGRAKARSSIRAGVQSTLVLGGRIKARSSARLLELHASLVVMGGKAAAQSAGGGFVAIASTRTRQYAVSVING